MTSHVIYPGSFDPVTVGHLDILERACGLFERVTVLVAADGKAGLLPLDQRVDLFAAAAGHLPRVTVEPFDGLLVDAVRARGAQAVVRGIRTAGDYEHEWGLAGVNALLAAEVEFVYFLARPSLAAVSSSLVRDVIRHGGNLDGLVPASVAAALADRRKD
jgi:pantetheine-phosphate adenylyltransferase